MSVDVKCRHKIMMHEYDLPAGYTVEAVCRVCSMPVGRPLLIGWDSKCGSFGADFMLCDIGSTFRRDHPNCGEICDIVFRVAVPWL